MRKNFYLQFLFVFLISCEDVGFEEASRVIVLEPFHAIEINGAFEIYLLQDTFFHITVKGDEEIIKDARFKVEADRLSVSNGHKRKWLSPKENKVKLFVSSPLLQSIEVNESCYIETINPILTDNFAIINHPTPKLCEFNIELDNGSFFYWNNYQCGGKVILRGRTGYLEAHTFALMTLDASQLIADDALIKNSSKGDCEVNVVQQLEYSIHNTGNIYLHMAPMEIILKERTSTGELIQLD